MVGTGLYLQQKLQQDREAPHKLRLELKMQVDERTSSFQQVCDGRYLWTHQDLLGKTSLARIDLRKIDSALATSSAAVRPSTALQIAGGGLPKLMQGLADNFTFDSPTNEQLDGLAVLSLAGNWRPERLVLLVPEEKAKLEAGQGVDPTKIPAQMPERVVVKLGADDYFPYRVEFWRRELTGDQKAPLGPFKAVVVMEFYEVQVNPAIDARQFDYKPGDLEFSDHTKELLRTLGIDPDAPPPTATQPVQQR
jgi:hypothetical protein